MEFPNYIQAYFQPKVICLFVSLWLKSRSLASSSHKKSQSIAHFISHAISLQLGASSYHNQDYQVLSGTEAAYPFQD
jgi:hypothetical protein